MTDQPITSAFILAAGKGTRMRPLTDTCPKPLLKVAGKPIIGYALDALKQAGVTDIVVNLNYLGDQLEAYLKTRTEFNLTLSWEDELLETGGGVKKELARFGDAPFYVLNGDVIWDEGAIPALLRLKAAWDPAQMDALLLLQPRDSQPDFEGAGDYFRDPDSLKLIRRTGADATAPYIFAGPRIIHAPLFKDSPAGAFSFLTLFDRAEAAGRLSGLVHDAQWYHVGTPKELEKTDALLRRKSAA